MMKNVAGGRIIVNDLLCFQCGDCEELCPTGALSLSVLPEVGKCVACRLCLAVCPVSALSFPRKKGVT